MLLTLIHNFLSSENIYTSIRTTLVFASLVFAILVLIAGAALLYNYPWRFQRIGFHGRSNLADQCDNTYEGRSTAMGDEHATVKALYIHPIKSCRPIELSRALLTKTGFAYDRCFVLATEFEEDGLSEWRMLSQRTKPQMSQICVEIWVLRRNKHEFQVDDGFMTILFPFANNLSVLSRLQAVMKNGRWQTNQQVRFTVPLMPTRLQQRLHDIQIKAFTIHGRPALGLDYSTLPSVAAILPQLKSFLKIPAKQGLMLLRCTSDTLTRTTLNLAPLKHIGSPAVHGYTDQQPLHIINLPSVHAVSSLLPPENQPLDARRFRANIYLTGPASYEEETWKRVRITSSQTNHTLQLSVVCRTSRCTMPNVNFEKGVFDHDDPVNGKRKGKPQPSTTLVEHRTVEDGNKKALGYLGMHCVPEDSSLAGDGTANGEVWVEVGDELRVLERGTHLYGSTANDY